MECPAFFMYDLDADGKECYLFLALEPMRSPCEWL